jgi:hypothetical protein
MRAFIGRIVIAVVAVFLIIEGQSAWEPAIGVVLLLYVAWRTWDLYIRRRE